MAWPPLPPPEEVLKRLSYAILQPEMSCAELAADFGLDGLPIVDNPAEAGMPYQEVAVTASDNHPLRVWLMPATDSRGIVIVSSGNSGPMSCYLFTADLLTRSGWSAVMYDYEGFGGSGGQASLATLRDDLRAVVDWVVTHTGNPQVSLFGMSLGSIPSIAVAIDQPETVNAVILDSPVALGHEIQRFGFLVRGRWREIMAALSAVAPWLLTEQTITQMKQPLLVFVHERDVVTPPQTIATLIARAAGPVELVYFTGLGHAAGQFERTEEYRAHLESFLDRVWTANQ